MAESTETRLDELESQLAFQEDALEQFNTIVTRQQGEIDGLSAQIRFLQDQLAELAAGAERQPASLEHEKPPHY